MSSHGATIRPAAISDYDDLCALWMIIDEEHRLALPNIFRIPAGAQRERSYVESLMDGSHSTILVVEGGEGTLVGMATIIIRMQPEVPIRAERRYAEIDDIVVKPSLRRQGLGRALIEAASEWAAGRGIKTLELSVHEFNDEALLFYRSVGFSNVLRRLARAT